MFYRLLKHLSIINMRDMIVELYMFICKLNSVFYINIILTQCNPYFYHLYFISYFYFCLQPPFHVWIFSQIRDIKKKNKFKIYLILNFRLLSIQATLPLFNIETYRRKKNIYSLMSTYFFLYLCTRLDFNIYFRINLFISPCNIDISKSK